MTTYRNIHGRSIQAVTTDPSESVAEGQVWYNTTSDTFKTVLVSEATSSAGALSTTRAMCAGGGIQTAAFLCGGSTGAPTSGTTHTENYNGSGWSTQGNMSNGRAHFGATGPQTAGLAVAGGPPFSPSPGGAQNNVEEYDGEAWTGGGAIPTNVWSNGCFGIQTAAVSVGSEPNTTNYVFEYDGSSWTTGGTMNNIRSYVGTAGTLTAGIVFAGANPSAPVGKATELYDGTNWTSGPLCSAITYSMFCGGSQTSALKAGGLAIPSSPSAVSSVIEKYDGSSWSTSPATLATARGYSKGQTQNSPSNTAGLFSGGTTAAPAASAVGSTEEFNISANVITAGAFSNGGNLNTARWGLGACGTKAAGIAFGGRNPPVGQDLARSEQYDGSSWSEGPDLNTATRVCGKGTGTQTAALKHGGHYGSPSTRYKVAEEWDGSSWTNGGTSSNAHDGTMQIGTQTAAASCGGYDGAPMNETEEYNGTSFSTANTMTYSGYSGGSSGPQTAAVVFAGGFPAVFTSSEYDGTNWTAGGTLPSSRGGYGTTGNTGNGSQTAAIGAGGYVPGPSYLNGSFIYDGTVFTTGPNIATARSELASGGPNSSFYVTGGLTPAGSASNATEEFTEETTAVNVKTLTQS